MMRKLILFAVCFIPAGVLAQGLSAMYSFTTYSSQQGNYVDINTAIELQGLEVKNDNAQVELTTLICEINDTKNVLYLDKRDLNAKKSSEEDKGQMLDIQRVKLNNGTYLLYMSFKDKNSPAEVVEIKDVIKMDYRENELAVSDVQIIMPPKKSTSKTLQTKRPEKSPRLKRKK